jgi:hypothetical protein
MNHAIFTPASVGAPAMSDFPIDFGAHPLELDCLLFQTLSDRLVLGHPLSLGRILTSCVIFYRADVKAAQVMNQGIRLLEIPLEKQPERFHSKHCDRFGHQHVYAPGQRPGLLWIRRQARQAHIFHAAA